MRVTIDTIYREYVSNGKMSFAEYSIEPSSIFFFPVLFIRSSFVFIVFFVSPDPTNGSLNV